MKFLQFSSIILLSLILVFSCNKEEEPEFIDPSDIEALSEVLIFPSGSDRVSGMAPSPTSLSGSPVIDSPISTITSSNGSTAPLEFTYGQVTDNLAGCYIQIPGTSTFINVPYSSVSNATGSLSVPVGIPANVLEGSFDLNFCVYDNGGLVSNVISTQVNVLRLGTGSLQISLSWNTATDQDLHVEEPGGEVISFRNDFSLSGGQLDRDDIDGFGPENIFWLDDAPDGEYKVQVDDYNSSSTENTVYVTITSPGKTKRFTATTINGSTVDITNIIKSGENYNY